MQVPEMDDSEPCFGGNVKANFTTRLKEQLSVIESEQDSRFEEDSQLGEGRVTLEKGKALSNSRRSKKKEKKDIKAKKKIEKEGQTGACCGPDKACCQIF